jgi:hypothetical protein
VGLWVSESKAPWGEAAMNLRMMYLACELRAASDGYEVRGRERAAREAVRVLGQLMR